MRTSTTVTSGWCSATAASRSSALPTAAITWWPRSARSSARPARTTAESSAITIRMGPLLSGAGREIYGDNCGSVRRAVDLQPSVHGLDPVGEASESTTGLDAGAACAVVADANPNQPMRVRHMERGASSTTVLGHICEQLGGAEVGDGLDRGRWTLGQVDDQLNRHVATCGEG